MPGGDYGELGGRMPAITSLNASYSTSLSIPSPYLFVPPAERKAISDVRRTFCLFVTFDLLFISLLWIIELNVSVWVFKGPTLCQIDLTNVFSGSNLPCFCALPNTYKDILFSGDLYSFVLGFFGQIVHGCSSGVNLEVGTIWGLYVVIISELFFDLFI